MFLIFKNKVSIIKRDLDVIYRKEKRGNKKISAAKD
jgi:hypothetical protein